MTHRHPGPSQDRQEWQPRPARGREPGGESALVRFAREYGWRAYAIPVLAVITIFVVADMVTTPDSAAIATSADGTGQSSEAAGHSGESTPREHADMPVGTVGLNELPPGGPFTEAGAGTYTAVGRPGMDVGAGEEVKLRYVVEVEDGVDTSSYGGSDAFASLVDATLSDPRGWTNDPRFGFAHVGPEDNPDLRIRLSSAATTREMCGQNLGLETSCRTTLTGESTVVVNEARWVRGAAPFQGDLGSYRQYLINHEVGHALGFAAHEPCTGTGNLAPVMMQQTISLNNAELHKLDPEEVYPDSDETCRPNPWPYPRPAVL